jgi:bifunctional non-homologous end joining protein LigD
VDRLERYREKRDFEDTPEPSGDGAPAPAEAPRFVIQEHSATRLHWDLRLERDGVLASWAVPNGIPDSPDENRKAVHTEDHPLQYLDFEGDIPAGSYGAGTMSIWDHGTYECHKWTDGKIVLTFHGERVQGRYALFRAGRDERDWLLHRMDPAVDPGREPLPDHVVPMLARSSEMPRDESAYAFEIKWDGIRAIAFSEPGRIRFESRNLNDVTAAYPELRRLNRALGSRSAVLDGEIVAFDERGRPSFERLQSRMHVRGESAVRRLAAESPVQYVVFDVLYLDGRSLLSTPYRERRALLESLELNGPCWTTPRFHPGEGTALQKAARAQGLEGVIAKRLDSRYEPGGRSGTWLKIKNTMRQELVIAGWVPGEGRRENRIGALLMGYHDEDGALRFAGKVGTGFKERDLDMLARRLRPLRRQTSPFTGRQPEREAQFVEPRLVAEIELVEWTKQGSLRAPSFKGLREDKDAAEVVREQLQPAPSGGGDELGEILNGDAAEAKVEVEGRELKLTNLGKLLFPASGVTKGQIIDYYRRIGPVLLPHLRGRPLTLKRYPNGVDHAPFYQKQAPTHRPGWVETARVGDIDYCLVQDLPTLVWSANLADLELHPSLSLAADIQRPTMMMFDLDPGPPADLLSCCHVALLLHGLFEQLKLQSFAKTSGSKGMQICVPLTGDQTYAQTKPFSKAVAETLAKRRPDLVVSRQTKAIRTGKVLVDWSQNDEHKTTVCVYSLRARERPMVSAPLTWDEVADAAERGDASHLDLDWLQVLERVERDGDLFAPMLSARQALPAIAG